MARTGVCSDCVFDPPTTLANPKAKTCSDACRGRRSRRLARQRKKSGQNRALPDHQKAMSQAVRKEVGDTMKDVVREELRPVVREAITEDVLRAAQDLVNLTPTMVGAITEDLNSSDKILRQRAYTLLAKYTLGNQSIAPAQATPSTQPMQVNFVLPRPSDTGAPQDAPVAAVELRECIECHTDKPDDQFVGSSNRCVDCHREVEARVRARFGEA